MNHQDNATQDIVVTNTHDLNKRLAEIIGLDVYETLCSTSDGSDPRVLIIAEGGGVWNPIRKHSQMEQVVDWLIKNGYGLRMVLFAAITRWEVAIWKPSHTPEAYGHHENRLLALAQAICAAIPREET